MFGLKGACLSIDTACSSSLVGAHYAARDITAGDCDRALAAGVNLTLSPGKTSAFAITGPFPPQHTCTFTILNSFFSKFQHEILLVVEHLVRH